MRLVHVKTKTPVVEFYKEKTVFHNRFLEQEMRSMGIMIPHGLRGLYNGQDLIYLNDEHFQQAFKEVYYLTNVDHTLYKWE